MQRMNTWELEKYIVPQTSEMCDVECTIWDFMPAVVYYWPWIERVLEIVAKFQIVAKTSSNPNCKKYVVVGNGTAKLFGSPNRRFKSEAQID